MKVALSHRERPGQIYEDHVLHSESFEMLRNEKQVRNLGQAVRNEKLPTNKQCIRNIADDVQMLINGVQEDDFVQSVLVVLSKGKSPVIICYLTKQIDDMKRFCQKDTPVTLHSVIGIDRT